MRLAFAWPNATAPSDTLGKPAAELTHKDDPLISERSVTTGKTAQQSIPLQVPCKDRDPCLGLIHAHPRIVHMTVSFAARLLHARASPSAEQALPMQALSNAGHTSVFVLRAAPAADQPLVGASSGAPAAAGQAQAATNGSIAIHGADGGLAFGLASPPGARQTVFDAVLYRPVNTSFTGARPSPRTLTGPS